MYLDAFTLSALVDELLDSIAGGRVQDVLDVDENGIGWEVYGDHRRQYLYMSADHQQPRIHIVPERLRRGLPKPSQVGLLMRRFVEGGSIAHISQPAWERIIQIDVDGAEGAVSIILEPMERRSNLLIVREGIIMDCMRRVGADENRYRVSLPNHPYVLPPPQTGKLSPISLSLESLIGIFASDDAPPDPKAKSGKQKTRKTHQVLTAHLLGVSPLLAKEIVYRAAGTTDQNAVDADYERLHYALHEIVDPLGKRAWQPGIATGERGTAAYSVYPLHSVAAWTRSESVSAALTAYYSAPVGEEAYTAGKAPLLEAIHEARAKLNAKLASLKISVKDDREREFLRQSGELILAYQYGIGKGQTELRAQYDLEQPELVIAIDPTLTPLENAQRYFDKYNRAKRALDDVPRLIAETENDLAFLAQLETDLQLAANYPEIDEVQAALQTAGLWRGTPLKKASSSRTAPLRVATQDGFIIWVGRNSRQNEIVTFDKGSPLDTWLHARDVPGAHVIIKFDGRTIPEAVIERAAALAAYYSARRSEGKVPVDVTTRKYVRKIKGAAAGMVTYRNETTRTVTPRTKEDEAT
jgi:predicted ribosome quality control (RQC) complex YloA/Tae2 family protein